MPELEKTNSKDGKFYESNAGDGTLVSDQYLTGFKLSLTLLSVVLALFASALDQTIVSTILSTVGDEFGDFNKVGWLTSGYMLPMACLALSWGKISIAFGRKKTMLFGLFFFFIGSLIAALSKSMDMLIGARVIQGLGGSAIQAMTMVILSEVVPASKRSLSMTLIGITFSVASALGPFIGGSFTTHVTWRWCFWINLPISGIGFVFLMISFKPPKPEGDLKTKLAKIDFLGNFLMASGLVLVLLGLTFGGNDFAWKSAAVISCFILGGLLVIAFCVYNFKYSKIPIIMKEAATSPYVMTACFCGCFAFIQFMISIVYFSIYFQVVQGANAWQSGIDMLPMIITVPIVSISNGIFLRITRQIKLVLVFCGVCFVIGSGVSLLLRRGTTFGQHFGILVINGIASGLSFQSSLLSTQLAAPNTIPGSMIIVTALNNFFKSLGGVIGVVVGQLILQTSATSKMKDILNNLQRHSADYTILSNVGVDAIVANPSIVDQFPTSLKNSLIDAYVDSLHNIFYLSLASSCILLITSVFTSNKKLPKDGDIHTKNEPGDAKSTPNNDTNELENGQPKNNQKSDHDSENEEKSTPIDNSESNQS